MAVYLTEPYFCGGYSYDTAAAGTTGGCKLVRAKAFAATDLVAAGSGGGTCVSMLDEATASGPGEFYKLAKDVYDKS